MCRAFVILEDMTTGKTQLKFNSQAGFSLIEVVITTAISAVVLMGLFNVLLDTQRVDSVLQSMGQKADLRVRIMSEFLNDKSIQNTMADAYNSSLACLTSAATPCPPAGGPLRFRDASNGLITDPENPSRGFTRDGAVCNSFDATHGDPMCPFRLEVTWIAICSVATCAEPQFKLQARVIASTATGTSSVSALASNEELWTLSTVRDLKINSEIDEIDAHLGFNTCALYKSTGQVKCWGSGGVNGDGTFVHQFAAVTVQTAAGVPLTGITKLSVGGEHGCALQGATGKVYCWGHNEYGQIGQGVMNGSYPYATSVKMSPGVEMTNAVEIYAGFTQQCARLLVGGVKKTYCWGDGGDAVSGSFDYMKLGLGAGAFSHASYPVTPATVGFSPFDVWWRKPNENSDFSKGHPTPELFSGFPSDWKSLAFGHDQNCALTDNNQVHCWGKSIYGVRGDGLNPSQSAFSTNPSNRASKIGGGGHLDGVVQIDSSQNAICAVLQDKTVACWGGNGEGMLGRGDPLPVGSNEYIPERVVGPGGVGVLSGVRKIGMAQYNACAILESNEVYCWGTNHYGKLGINVDYAVQTSSAIPQKVINIDGLVPIDLALGGAHICLLFSNGKAKCWGLASQGLLGIPTPPLGEVRFPNLDVQGL